MCPMCCVRFQFVLDQNAMHVLAMFSFTQLRIALVLWSTARFLKYRSQRFLLYQNLTLEMWVHIGTTR